MRDESSPHHGGGRSGGDVGGGVGVGVGEVLAQVASTLPSGGEDRPGQVAMAEAVERAIDGRRHLVVQAGTGTGKSLAYLIPLALDDRKAVVATATKALQDQLATKDLPMVASALRVRGHRDLTFAVLKGRSNYLCRQRAAEMTGTSQPALLPNEETFEFDPPGSRSTSKGLVDELRRILAWAEGSESGDRADLEFEPSPRAWAALSVGARECPGAFKCPSGAVCFAERARALASAADVVVVNTHLYASHIASDGAVLPEHEVLVLDEAHAVEDIMTTALGVELTSGRLRAVAALSRGLAGDEAPRSSDALVEVAERFDGVLAKAAGRRVLRAGTQHEAPDGEPRRAPDSGRSRDATDARAADEELFAVLVLMRNRLENLLAALRRSAPEEEDGGERTRAQLVIGHLLDDISALESCGDEHVAWVDAPTTGSRSSALHLAPIEIGEVLAARLWPGVTAVLTSATIPPFTRGRLGLPKGGTDQMDVGSPFPFSDCALLYCPVDVPDPRQPGAASASQEELRRIIEAAGGRTLSLFTSWRAMRAAVEALRPSLEFELLAQGDLPKQKLVERFSAEESSCLFATMSFWQGVDVPGPTLSVVSIDRLPFPRPDDPLVQARRERAGPEAFRLVDLPRAATLLAQGAGRLIRSTADRGMVAVLDRRLATSTYGRTLRSVLPPMRLTTKREDAMRFLRALHEHEDLVAQ